MRVGHAVKVVVCGLVLTLFGAPFVDPAAADTESITGTTTTIAGNRLYSNEFSYSSPGVLGSGTIHTDYTVSFVPNGFVNVGSFVLTRSDGATTLHGTSTGTGNPTTIPFLVVIRLVVTSGTADFAGATGEIVLTGLTTGPTALGEVADMTGSLTLPPLLGYEQTCARTDSAPAAFGDAGLAADCLKAFGIALGKNDGTFGEDDSLLRSQVSSLLARVITTNGIPLSARRPFSDVNADTVPDPNVRDEIETLAGAGIMAGFPDGHFGPGGTLSVAQAATFVVRTLQYMASHHPTFGTFVDQGSTSSNYSYAESRGLLDPGATDVDGTTYSSGPSDQTMRGLLADMLAQSLQKLGKVYYADCAEATSAGAAHMREGDPGYRPALDPDSNGVAC